jgi:hypothetical protein
MPLQLTHFCQKLRIFDRIWQVATLYNSRYGFPIGFRCPGNPEQITVSNEAAVAPRHPAAL